ncbi:MAG: PASTA domain-containing protein, partial [Bacteroidetes bacterium]|nr:PASTA domain-containing protein [Bacteroidota bacterium]
PKYALAAPKVRSGNQPEIQDVLSVLKVKNQSDDDKSEWISATSNDSVSVSLLSKNIEETLKRGIVPNLVGMTARDVLYLLENRGMRVKLIGSGAVATQSITAGTAFIKGTQIVLQLL